MMMLRFSKAIRKTIPALLLLAISGFPMAGELEPPGPPAPTMKTLTEIEPRTIISSVPWTINAPGSYYLAGDIDASATGATGIRIEADNVTIDLGGFTLRGGQGHGIYVMGLVYNLEIRNGHLVGWTGDGLRLFNPVGPPYVDHARNSRVSGIHAAGNGGTGIRAGTANVVENCMANGNVEDGIWALYGSIIQGSVGMLNGDDGIEVERGSAVLDCIAISNTDDGIVLQNQSQVSRSSSYGNTGDGIEVNAECIVADNSSAENTVGILATNHANRIVSNNVSSNSRGIRVDPGKTQNVIHGNLLYNNTNPNSIPAGNILTDEATAAAMAAEATAQVAATSAASAETAAVAAAASAANAEVAGIAAQATAQTAATAAGNAEVAANTAAMNAHAAETAAQAAEAAAVAANDPRQPISALDLPYTIVTQGSYYLAESVTYLDSSPAAIVVDANDVTIDLMGFTLAGTVATPTGIQGNGTGLTVRNGSVRGWGGWGIDAGDGTRLESVTSEGNAGGGMRTGSESLIVHAAARTNGGDGITVGARSTISESIAAGNSGSGIVVTGSATVSRNQCSGNDQWGIHVSAYGSRIEENNVVDNQFGIEVVASGNVIVRNTVRLGQAFMIAPGNMSEVSTDLVGAGPWDNLRY